MFVDPAVQREHSRKASIDKLSKDADFRARVERGLSKFEKAFNSPVPNVPKRSSGDTSVELVAPTEEEVAEQAGRQISAPKSDKGVVLTLGEVSEERDILSVAACLGKVFHLQKSRRDSSKLSLTLLPQDVEDVKQRVSELRTYFKDTQFHSKGRG